MEMATRKVIFPGSVGLAQAHPLTKPLAMGDGLRPDLVQLPSTLPIRALVVGCRLFFFLPFFHFWLLPYSFSTDLMPLFFALFPSVRKHIYSSCCFVPSSAFSFILRAVSPVQKVPVLLQHISYGVSLASARLPPLSYVFSSHSSGHLPFV